MRLGAYDCRIQPGTKAFAAYSQENISERHRHRYEFNNHFRDSFEANGMVFSGISPDEQLIEILELKDHPWFIACQFHPELKSKPIDPHPLFSELVSAAYQTKNHNKNI
jgi:CTP synthase